MGYEFNYCHVCQDCLPCDQFRQCTFCEACFVKDNCKHGIVCSSCDEDFERKVRFNGHKYHLFFCDDKCFNDFDKLDDDAKESKIDEFFKYCRDLRQPSDGETDSDESEDESEEDS